MSIHRRKPPNEESNKNPRSCRNEDLMISLMKVTSRIVVALLELLSDLD